MMMTNTNFSIQEALSILELTEKEASPVLIKERYRKLMQTWHPDLFQNAVDIPLATSKSQQINGAYEILTEKLDLLFDDPNADSWNREYRPTHSYQNQFFTPGFPDETVFEYFVKSSHIISAGYNPESRMLYIKFVPDNVYEYRDVPLDIWTSFMSALSHGRFGQEHVYHSFEYRKCNEHNRAYNPSSAIRRLSRGS